MNRKVLIHNDNLLKQKQGYRIIFVAVGRRPDGGAHGSKGWLQKERNTQCWLMIFVRN